MTTPIANFSWLPFLADVALKSTLLLILAVLLVMMLRKSSAAVRYLTWSVALIGAILLPLLAGMLPAWPVSALGDWWPTVAVAPVVNAPQLEKTPVAPFAPLVAEKATTPVSMANAQRAAVDLHSPVISIASTTTQKFNLGDFLVRFIGLIWLVGVLLVLLPLCIGSWQVRRLTRRCVPLTGPEWTPLLKDTANSLGLRRPVRLLSSPGVTLPMTWGAWHPVILLPAEANTWTELRCRVVLQHELAHVQRWDWLMFTLAQCVCAFYWYNPRPGTPRAGCASSASRRATTWCCGAIHCRATTRANCCNSRRALPVTA